MLLKAAGKNGIMTDIPTRKFINNIQSGANLPRPTLHPTKLFPRKQKSYINEGGLYNFETPVIDAYSPYLSPLPESWR